MLILLIIGLVIAAHIAGLVAVIVGHWKLYRSKRAGHLFYVLPLSWYLFVLISLMVTGSLEEHWSRPIDWDYSYQYLTALISVVLASGHGLWVARLLHQPGRPVLCSLVLLSTSLLFLLPPLGLMLALVALRWIRQSEGRLFGRGGALASLVANGVVMLWLSAAWVSYCWTPSETSVRSANMGTPSVLPASNPAVAVVPTAPPLAISATGSQARAATPTNSGTFSGEWTAQFNFERNTRNPAEPPHPWESFLLSVTQEVHSVRGQMQGTSLGVSGNFSGSEENGLFHGTMRLSWDTHDWEELTLTLNEDRTRATGRAVFRASSDERHYYNLELRRR